MNVALITARQERGLSQKELANLLNVNTASVSRWEQGISHPHLYHRQKLALFFEKSEKDLGFHSPTHTEVLGGNEYLLLQCDILVGMARVARDLGDESRATCYLTEAWTLLSTTSGAAASSLLRETGKLIALRA